MEQTTRIRPDDVTPPDENSCPDHDDHGCKHRTPVQELKQDASAQSDDASFVMEPHHGKAVEQTTRLGETEQTVEAEQTAEDGRVAEVTERLGSEQNDCLESTQNDAKGSDAPTSPVTMGSVHRVPVIGTVEKQPSDESEQTTEQTMVDDRAEQTAAQVEQTTVRIASDQAGEEETGEVAVPSRQRCAQSDRAEEADEFEQQVDAVAEFQQWSMRELRRQGHSGGTVSAIESRIRQLGWSSRKNSLQALDPIWTHNPRSLFRMTNWRRLIKEADLKQRSGIRAEHTPNCAPTDSLIWAKSAFSMMTESIVSNVDRAAQLQYMHDAGA